MREVPDTIASKLVDSADAFAASFDHLRMDDIAHASGIPRATLYYYFSGKEDILAFLFNSMLADIGAELARAGTGEQPTRARLTELIRRLLAKLDARPAAAQLLVGNLGKAGKLPDMAAAVREALYAPFERVLADGVAAGELRVLDMAAAVTALYGGVSIVGLQLLVTEGGIDAERVSRALGDVFWSGLCQPGAGTGDR